MELLKCICGLCGNEEYPQVNKLNGFYFIECQILTCSCSIPQHMYTTPDEAARAWNAMQQALQNHHAD